MKNILLFLLFVILGLAGSWLYLNKARFSQPPAPVSEVIATAPTPTPAAYSYALPPTDSIVGSIVSFTGDVKWQSRIATEAASFALPQSISQGESIVTNTASQVKLDFPGVVAITAAEDTAVDVLQSLPTALVLRQDSGSVDYLQSGSIPIDIRTNFLLLRLSAAHLVLAVHSTGAYTTGTVTAGSVTLAYNDLKFISQLATVSAGQTFTINNTTRRLTLSSL